MEKLDKNLKIYLSILIISWIIIIFYFVKYEMENDVQKQLKTYPYNHSKITDSTLNNGK